MFGFFRWIQKLWKYLLVDQWAIIQGEIDREALPKVSYGPVVVMCWSAVTLTILEYYGHSGSIFYRWFRDVVPQTQYSSAYRHIYWALSCSTAYFVIPLVTIVFARKIRLRDYGLRLKGFFKHAWIYVVLYLIVLPAVVFVSYTDSFQRTYPFYRYAHRSLADLGIWWFFYGIQFFFLEFFFRGYMLHGTKRAVGAYAIFVSAIPYCMIHYGKPMPETLGAIIAGIALGTLSLRTRSIWSGFLIHISIAYSMDLLSIWQKGKFSIFM